MEENTLRYTSEVAKPIHRPSDSKASHPQGWKTQRTRGSMRQAYLQAN